MIELPAELQEKILGYINYNDLINYNRINKRCAQICNDYCRRWIKDRRLKDLLRNIKIDNRYTELYVDEMKINDNNFIIKYVFVGWRDEGIYANSKEKILDYKDDIIQAIFKKCMDGGDINRIIWLTYIIILSDNISLGTKINLFLRCIYYAFMINNDNIGKWLTYMMISGDIIKIKDKKLYKKLFEDNDLELNLIIVELMDILINNFFDRNRKDLVYYFMHEFSDFVPIIKSLVLLGLAKKDDVESMKMLTKFYDFQHADYWNAILKLERNNIKGGCFLSLPQNPKYNFMDLMSKLL